MNEKEHLSESGLLKFLSLKSVLNWGLSEAANNLTDKKIETQVRPLHLVNSVYFKKIDPHWISGLEEPLFSPFGRGMLHLVLKLLRE